MDGFPTRALYGFTTMMARLQRVWEPDYVAVCFDIGKTFRHERYPAYKGHRPDMPEELRQQWPKFRELIEAFGYRYLAVPGFEADDAMGTLAHRYASEALEVLLVTGDKDFCQLVNPNIRILDLMKDVEIGPNEVIEKFGVPAERVIDILALAGDSADNIPGVPGVGAKTAVKLLTQFGTLDEVLEGAHSIKGKRGENLRNHKEDALLSRWLATINVDCPVGLELDDLRPKGLQEEPLRSLFEQWDFGKVAKRLLGDTSSVDLKHVRAVQTSDDLAQLVASLTQAGVFAFDTETTSLNPRESEIVGLSFSWSDTDAVYVPIGHTEGEQLSSEEVFGALKPLLEDAQIGKVGQNLKYDLAVCRNSGIDLKGIVGDTMLLDYVLAAHARRHGLDDLAQRHLNHSMISYSDVTDDEALTFSEVSIDDALEYAGEDALVSWLVHEKLLGRLEEGQRWIYESLELPLIPVLAQMEEEGIGIDLERLAHVREGVAERLKVAEARCHEIVGRPFPVGSIKQLQIVLFEELGYEPVKKTKTGFSTDSSVLEKLSGLKSPDLPAAILEYRMLKKLLSTYLKKLPTYVDADGRIRTSLKQAVAATGRLASAEPNLQNIPIRTEEGKRIRACFVPKPGHLFLSADYSQVELRVLAHFCASDTLKTAFQNGEDIHRRTASEIFGVPLEEVDDDQRSAAKAINFGLLYGMSAFRLAGDLEISRAQASQYMDEYFGRMPEVGGWLESIRENARKDGFVTTLFGRRRILPAISSQRFNERMGAEREAVNTVIQGTAADIIKIAMLKVSEALLLGGFAARMILQVHDELLLEVPAEEIDSVAALVKREMEHAVSLSVPLVVNSAVGENWNEAHG